MRNFNLDQLQTLVAAADLGTLAAAAQALHLSPPAVSLHISELEARVGTALLRRGRGRATLTPAGEELVAGARRILAGCAETFERTRRRGQGLVGMLRLAATAGVDPQLLPRLLDELERRAPGIEVRLDARSSLESLEGLRAGALDAAIVALPLSASAEVRVLPWRDDPMAAFLPAGWTVPARVTPRWLAERSWMSFAPPTQMNRLVTGWFARAGVPAHPRFALNLPEALKALVVAGHGAALLPRDPPDTGDSAAWMQVRPLDPPLARAMGLAFRAQRDPLLETALEVLSSFGNRR